MSAFNQPHQQDGVKNEKCLTLVVVNTHQLGAGLSATHTFDRKGGDIGSRPEADWVLRDHDGGVNLSHAQISMIDGYFCLTDAHGACFINGATAPLGLKKSVKLNENDMIGLGNYQVRVNFYSKEEIASGNWHGLEQAFAAELVGNLVEGPYLNARDNDPPEPRLVDPLFALDATKDMLDASSEPQGLVGPSLLSENTPSVESVTVQADSEYEMGSAIALKKSLPPQECTMDENILESLEEEMGRHFSPSPSSSSAGFSQDHMLAEFDHDLQSETHHMVVAPILRGLGVQVGDANNMAKMQALGEEMGATLKAVIEGLLSLHQQVGDSRFGVMNKNLQPIEDNPLRLGLSYPDTVQTLFDGQRSAVHLCAPAAIEETLRNVKNHNDAVQSATSFALKQILHAFSPEVLLKRFTAYRRPGQEMPESKEAWAWQMYQSYYRELTSHRQKGFEKLFWEIFEQAYDKEIREKQREP